MSKKFGIIVDGQGDFAAINKRMGANCKVLKTDGPRGHTVAIEELAQSSKKQINMLRFFGCSVAVIVTDFEERTEDYGLFLSRLKTEFGKLSLPIPVQVAVPNRMIENWYLADIEHLSRKKTFLRNNLKQKNYEGKHGKHVLKQLLRKGIHYNEVKHGQELFEILRFPVARQNSRSFNEFLHCLGN